MWILVLANGITPAAFVPIDNNHSKLLHAYYVADISEHFTHSIFFSSHSTYPVAIV